MIIRRMSASFGALENRKLELKPGLNIIHAPNEWGKSTWCAFISAMLYGIDSSSRAKSGFIPDKIRFKPWSGAAMEGTMELEWRGMDITLHRKSGKGSTPMQDFSAVYTGTGEPVPELTGTNAGAGEMLCGVPKSVFQRSAFIGQAALGVDRAPELEKRILAISSSGEEDSSYTEADGRLRSWLRKRRHNRYGALPAIEDELEASKARLAGLEDADRELQRLRSEAESAELRVNSLKREVEEARANQRNETLRLLSESRAGLTGLENAADEARAELARAIPDALSVVFTEEPDSLREEVAQALERARGLEAVNSPSKWWLITPIVLFALAILSVSGLFGYIWVAAIAFAFAGTVLLVMYLRKAKSAQTSQRELIGILSGFSAGSADELAEAFARYEKICRRRQVCKEKLAAAIEELESARGAQKKLNAELLSGLDFVNGNADTARLGRALAKAEDEYRALRESVARAEGRQRSLGDPLVLQSELSALQSRYMELTGQYSALELAICTLGEANAEIQSRFAPLLGKRASELIGRMTHDRYDSLTFDRDFSAQAKLKEQSVPRNVLQLSQGSADQVYLALRLSICELVLPSDDPCPIVLDEALSSFDDTRLKLALGLLSELAEQRQIIIFTCHNRESSFI